MRMCVAQQWPLIQTDREASRCSTPVGLLRLRGELARVKEAVAAAAEVPPAASQAAQVAPTASVLDPDFEEEDGACFHHAPDPEGAAAADVGLTPAEEAASTPKTRRTLSVAAGGTTCTDYSQVGTCGCIH